MLFDAWICGLLDILTFRLFRFFLSAKGAARRLALPFAVLSCPFMVGVIYPILYRHPSPYYLYAQVSDLLQQRGKYRKLFGVKSELFEVATLYVGGKAYF